MKRNCLKLLLFFSLTCIITFAGCGTDADIQGASESGQVVNDSPPAETANAASEHNASPLEIGLEESNQILDNAVQESPENQSVKSASEKKELSFYRISGKTSAIPAFFEQILFRLDEAREKNIGVGWEREYDKALSSIELRNGAYHIENLKLPDGSVLEKINIDLSDYLPQSTSRTWEHSNGYFYASNNTVYLAAALSWGDDKVDALLLLVEFEANDPSDYAVTVFDSQNRDELSWFYGTYAIDGVLYQKLSGSDVCAYDLMTKERRFFDEEKELVEKTLENYTADYERNGINLALINLDAITKMDDVVILAGYASDRSDWDMLGTLMTVYVACRNGEALGVMAVDEKTGLVDLY